MVYRVKGSAFSIPHKITTNIKIKTWTKPTPIKVAHIHRGILWEREDKRMTAISHISPDSSLLKRNHEIKINQRKRQWKTLAMPQFNFQNWEHMTIWIRKCRRQQVWRRNRCPYIRCRNNQIQTRLSI